MVLKQNTQFYSIYSVLCTLWFCTMKFAKNCSSNLKKATPEEAILLHQGILHLHYWRILANNRRSSQYLGKVWTTPFILSCLSISAILVNCKFKEEKKSLPILNMRIGQSQLCLSSFYSNCGVHFQIPHLGFQFGFLRKKGYIIW